MAFPTNQLAPRNTSRFPVILTTVFLSCLLVFILLAYQVVYLRREGFDRQVMGYFSQHRDPVLVQLMRYITFLGSSFFLLPAYVLLIGYLTLKRLFREGCAVAAISFFGWLLLSQLKTVFHRHRPDVPLVTDITTYSFPSAHAFSSLIFFSVLVFVLVKWQALSRLKRFTPFILLLFPVLVGLSRIILNVHYPSDVLAGYCLATMWLILSYLAYRKLITCNPPGRVLDLEGL